MRDLLVSGPEREPRRLPRHLRRLGLLAVVVAAVVGGTGALVQSRAQERAEQRARDAAFAEADEVHLRGRLVALVGGDPGTGRLVADVAVTGERRGRLTSVRIEGPGLTSAPGPAPVLRELPGQVLAETTVDCGRVPERIPERAEVVVTVVPPSGVAHEQRLPAAPAALRAAVLDACDEPDPLAEPLVEVSALDSRLVLYVETVPRSDADLRLERVTVPGFAVAAVPGSALPRRLPPGSGGLYAFSVRVADCAVARGSDGAVTVRLRSDGVPTDRVAAPARVQLQQGGVPVAELLAALADDTC